MNYTYNKMPKLKELCQAVRRSIVKDIRRNGLTMEDFAHEIGVSQGTLENKLKPASPYDLTLTEFVHILDITGDYAPLEELAKRYGFVLCRPDARPMSTEDPVSLVTIGTLDLGAVFGDLERRVKESIEDGRLDEEERKDIADLLYLVRKIANGLEQHVRKGGEDDD